MTSRPTSSLPHLPRLRPRLAVARDLIVVGLCALVVGGFLVDVGRGAQARRPAVASGVGVRT